MGLKNVRRHLNKFFDLGKCHCRINRCCSTLIEPTSIVLHVVRVGVALVWSIRVDLGLILGIGVALGSSLSIEVALGSNLSIEVALGLRLAVWGHVIIVFVQSLRWKETFFIREQQNQATTSPVFSLLNILLSFLFFCFYLNSSNLPSLRSNIIHQTHTEMYSPRSSPQGPGFVDCCSESSPGCLCPSC